MQQINYSSTPCIGNQSISENTQIDDKSKNHEILNIWLVENKGKIFGKNLGVFVKRLEQAIDDPTTTSIDISGLDSLPNVKLPNIKHLNISGQEFIKSLDLTNFPNLTSLDVSGCDILEKLDLSNLPELTSLNISNCYALRELNVTQCNNLTSLDTSGCFGIERLDFSNLPKLASLDLSDCSNLQELNVTQCHGLTKLNTYRCTKLIKLNVTQCNNLTSLDISGESSLEKLILSNLPELTSLDLSDCSKLQELNVTQCNKLASLDISRCYKLEKLDLSNFPKLTSLKGLEDSSLKDLRGLFHWLTLAGRTVSEVLQDWKNLNEPLSTDEPSGYSFRDFSNLLLRLYSEAKNMVDPNHVLMVIDEMVNSPPGFRSLAFKTADDGLTNCHDRALFTFNTIQGLAKMNQLQRLKIGEQATLNLAIGLVKQSLLDQFTVKIRPNSSETLEVALALRQQLATDLRLPFPVKQASYTGIANLTEEEKKLAIKYVDDVLKDQNQLIEHLTASPIWQEHCMLSYSQEIQKIKMEFSEKEAELFDKKDDMKEGDYLLQANSILPERNDAINRLISDKTKAIIARSHVDRQKKTEWLNRIYQGNVEGKVTQGKEVTYGGTTYTLQHFEGLVYRGDSRPFDQIKATGGLLSKQPLDTEERKREAQGLGKGLGATGQSGVSAAKDILGALPYCNYGKQDGYIYLIDTRKLGETDSEKEEAYDMEAILAKNKLEKADETGAEVNITNIKWEAVIGWIQLTDAEPILDELNKNQENIHKNKESRDAFFQKHLRIEDITLIE